MHFTCTHLFLPVHQKNTPALTSHLRFFSGLIIFIKLVIPRYVFEFVRREVPRETRFALLAWHWVKGWAFQLVRGKAPRETSEASFSCTPKVVQQEESTQTIFDHLENRDFQESSAHNVYTCLGSNTGDGDATKSCQPSTRLTSDCMQLYLSKCTLLARTFFCPSINKIHRHWPHTFVSLVD